MINRILVVTVCTIVTQISLGDVTFGQSLEISPFGIERIQKDNWSTSGLSERKLNHGISPSNSLYKALRNLRYRKPETQRPAEPGPPTGCGILNPRCVDLPQQLDR